MSRKRLIGFALLAVVVVAGSITAGWLTWSARIADDVAVTWSSDSPACSGTTVKDADSQRPIIEADESMRCVITVQVTNGSDHTVHVAQALASGVGPRTGAVVMAEDARAAPKSDPNEAALFELDQDLAEGASMTFDVVLVLNPRGCNTAATVYESHWPTVTIDALGRSHDLRGDKDFAFHREGVTPGCLR